MLYKAFVLPVQSVCTGSTEPLYYRHTAFKSSSSSNEFDKLVINKLQVRCQQGTALFNNCIRNGIHAGRNGTSHAGDSV